MEHTEELPTALVRMAFTPETKALDVEAREVEHLISTDSVDRAGDVVEPEGWDLESYRRNPVVLVDHNYSIHSIVGRAVRLVTSKAGLMARTKFNDLGVGLSAFQLVADGFAKAWSVGFAPKEYHSVREGAKQKCAVCKRLYAAQIEGKADEEFPYVRGRHFLRQELLEYSLVAVPMNPDAVMQAIQRGVVTPETARVLLDARPGTPVPAAQGPTVKAESRQVHPALLSAFRREDRRFALSEVEAEIGRQLARIRT